VRSEYSFYEYYFIIISLYAYPTVSRQWYAGGVPRPHEVISSPSVACLSRKGWCTIQ
jgi:hypothetical protein